MTRIIITGANGKMGHVIRGVVAGRGGLHGSSRCGF